MLNYFKEFKIKKDTVGVGHPTYFIADIAANHDGDLHRAKDLIWLAKEAGANAAKFQHFEADSIVSDFGFKKLGAQLSHQSKWKKSVYDVYKDASVNFDWTEELKSTCEKVGITFFTSPYSLDIVERIDEHVPAYKIGSGDITWTEIIERIASKNKPYILATGASTLDDVVRAVKSGVAINPNIALLQCNTNYTASLDNLKYVNLNVLKTYSEMFPGMILGLSDHTPGHATVLGAVALGASIIEKHFTDDKNREGPDHAFSMNKNDWQDMVNRTRELEAALGSGLKEVENNEMQSIILQRRAIRASKTLNAGSVIKIDDLEVLRPCPIDAIPPFKLNLLIGKRLKNSISRGEYLKDQDFE